MRYACCNGLGIEGAAPGARVAGRFFAAAAAARAALAANTSAAR